MDILVNKVLQVGAQLGTMSLKLINRMMMKVSGYDNEDDEDDVDDDETRGAYAWKLENVSLSANFDYYAVV